MTYNRYPYTHHGPSVYGSKMMDYMISEHSLIEDLEDMARKQARFKWVLAAFSVSWFIAGFALSELIRWF